MRLLSTCGYKWHKFSYALIGGLFGCGASILVNQSKDWGLPSITKITDEDLLEITLAEDVTKALKELQWYDGLPTDIIDGVKITKTLKIYRRHITFICLWTLRSGIQRQLPPWMIVDVCQHSTSQYSNSRPTSKNAVNDNERDCIAHCRKLRSAEIGYYPFLAFSPSVFKRYLRCRSCDD